MFRKHFLIPLAAILLAAALGGAPAYADCTEAAGLAACTGTDTNGFLSDSSGLVVNVEDGATVTNPAGDAIHLNGTGNTILNDGTVVSGGSDGIDVKNDTTIVNTGVIRSTAANGIDGNPGGNIAVVNSGTITGRNDGIDLSGLSTITNSGVIAGNRDGVDLDFGQITNSGTIAGGNTPDGGFLDAAIEIDGGGATNIVNSGTLAGYVGIVDKGGNPTHVTTSGDIIGTGGIAIATGGGNDRVLIQGGTITGLVDGGAGMDTLAFRMEVGAESFEGLMATLEASLGSSGTVTINGQTYTWTNFEALRNLLRLAMLRDARINALDFAAPDALYCAAEGGISVYAIGANGQGTLAFQVSAAAARAGLEQAAASGGSVLIHADAASGASLRALSAGGFEFNGPDGYVFRFAGNTCGISDPA